MSAITAIVAMIGKRLIGRRVALILALLTLAPAVVLIVRDDGDQTAAFHNWVGPLLFALALPLVALLTSSAALGEERFGHTLPYLMVKPIARTSIAGAGWLAATMVSFAIGMVGVGSAWAVAAVRTGETGIGWGAAVGAAITMIGYAAVFVPVGLMARQSTLIGLAFILIWEGVIAGAGDTLAVASLWRTGLSGYVAVTPDVPADVLDALGNLTPGAWGAFAKVLVLSAMSIAGTTLLLRHRDLVKE